MPSLVEMGPAVLEKKFKMWKVYRRTDRRKTTGDQKSSLELQRSFFIFLNVFSLFWLWFPLGKGSVPFFEQTWTSFIHWYTLCQVWLKFLQWYWRLRFLKYFFNVIFAISLISIFLPWKKACPFIWINLNFLHPMIHVLCAKFGWNWSVGFGEFNFFEFCQCCHTISLLSPLEKRRGPLFEHIWISRLPNSYFCQVLLKLAQWVWEKMIWLRQCFFSLFRYYLPLKRGVVLH